jgi:hypothetical protein
MTPIVTSQDAAEAKYALEQAMLDGQEWSLLVGEILLTKVNRQNCELSVEWGKLIFAWWNDEHSQSWRVTGYTVENAELLLQVRRGMGRELTTIALRHEARWREKIEFENLALSERRQRYAQLLSRLLAAQSGCAHPPNMTTGADHRHLTPGKYARSEFRRGGETTLVIGACEAESQAEIDGIIAAGLVWLANFNAQREAKQQLQQKAGRLWFCLPSRHSEFLAQTAIERLTLLNTSHLDARIECFEVDERHEALRRVQLAAQDELLNAHPRELKWPEAVPPENPWRERILRLAPGVIEIRQLPERESYAIHGLEFARFSGGERPRVTFGVAGARQEYGATILPRLSEANFHRLELLVREIVEHRSSVAGDRRHPFYRLREEAWLESLLRQNIRALDAAFDDRFVYSQIPAWRGDERSVIDLLTVRYEAAQEPRLAVIEIKASEDPQLPLQGLDYWLRVEQARLRGEFERRGLFPGIRLADQPPLLYLVAPRLRFHRTFAIVARCLSPQIEAYQVGVNANWRAGVRVRSFERVNASDMCQ